MDLSGLKSTTPNKHFFRKVMAVLFSLVVIVVSYMFISNAGKDANDQVEILRVKVSDGIPAYVVLSEQNVETYNIIRTEYTADMILAEDFDSIKDKLTKYYIRKNSPLYKDQIIDEKPQKNEWLYHVDEANEVLTLPYNFLEVGGDILVPGDRVRIRVSYEEEVNEAADSSNPYASGSSKNVKKTEVLFDSIVIKDMLNSKSHSIYEVYKEVQRLNEDKKQEVMKSEEFLANIQPRALLLEGTGEQINNYSKYKGLSGESILITILSRENSTIILDQLPTLEKEVESWIEKEEN